PSWRSSACTRLPEVGGRRRAGTGRPVRPTPSRRSSGTAPPGARPSPSGASAGVTHGAATAPTPSRNEVIDVPTPGLGAGPLLRPGPQLRARHRADVAGRVAGADPAGPGEAAPG